MNRDIEINRWLVQRAKAAGFSAIVLTADALGPNPAEEYIARPPRAIRPSLAIRSKRRMLASTRGKARSMSFKNINLREASGLPVVTKGIIASDIRQMYRLQRASAISGFPTTAAADRRRSTPRSIHWAANAKSPAASENRLNRGICDRVIIRQRFVEFLVVADLLVSGDGRHERNGRSHDRDIAEEPRERVRFARWPGARAPERDDARREPKRRFRRRVVRHRSRRAEQPIKMRIKFCHVYFPDKIVICRFIFCRAR